MQLSGITVLVVDDDVDVQNYLSLQLQDAGASVHQVGSAAETLAYFQKHNPQVVVLEVAAMAAKNLRLFLKTVLRPMPPAF